MKRNGPCLEGAARSFVRNSRNDRSRSIGDGPWRDLKIRYLVHFSDGGSGMRFRDEPLDVGAVLEDGGARYRVERVEQPPNPRAFGYAWATRLDGAE